MRSQMEALEGSQVQELLFPWSLGYTILLALKDALINPEAVRIPLFKVFTEVLLSRHDRLNHWLMVIRSVPSPSPIPGGPANGTERFRPPIIWLVPLATRTLSKSYLGVPATSHVINIYSGVLERDLWITKDNLLSLIIQEIMRALEALCQELWVKTKYLFLLHHNITVDLTTL